MIYDTIIVGAGFAGATMAERFANDSNNKVLLIEKRNHIGGNMYDYIDENKVNRHEYGPHIFHTSNNEVYSYLSNFTKWYDYKHTVKGLVDGKIIPIPFNLTSIEKCFDNDKANRLKQLLIEEYGMETKVPILTLRANENKEIKELAEYIFENVFKHYTMKQWGLQATEIDPAVTARVPVAITYDDGYFGDKYQCMPKDGYTAMFEKMLSNKNVDVLLNTEAKDLIKIDLENNCIMYNNELFNGNLIFTGAVDDFLDYPLGVLPYRSLNFIIETHEGTYQEKTTINYPTAESVHGYTRITEYKNMMENPPLKTTIAIEYPMAYDKDAKVGNVPYYPIFNEESNNKYLQTKNLLNNISNIYLLGRLAEYKYYNMDAIVARSIELYKEIIVK